MSALITVAEDDQRQRLLNHHSSPPNGHQHQEIAPYLSSDQPEPPSSLPNQRLISLDVFRGLTVALIP